MNAVRLIRAAVCRGLREAEEAGDTEKESEGMDAFSSLILVEHALWELTKEHGSQCSCPGCRALHGDRAHMGCDCPKHASQQPGQQPT
jgi:hypothetical protein